jgi:hypothetical protein
MLLFFYKTRPWGICNGTDSQDINKINRCLQKLLKLLIIFKFVQINRKFQIIGIYLNGNTIQTQFKIVKDSVSVPIEVSLSSNR